MRAARQISARNVVAAMGAGVVLLLAFGTQSSLAADARSKAQPRIIYSGQVAVTQMFTSAAAPYWIAKRLGYYKAAGLDLKFVSFSGGTDTVNGIRSMGFGFASTFAGLLGVANGVDIKIVGGGFNTPGEEFLVPANSRLRTIQDMRGRTTKIAVSRPASNTEFYIKGLAKLLRLELGKDIQMVYIGDIAAAWTAAKQGLVDAAYSGPPLSTQLVQAGEARVWIKASRYFHFPATVSWATSDFIRDHPEVIRRWMRVQQRANKLILNNLDKAARAYAKGANLTPSVARQALKEYLKAYSTDIRRNGIRKVVQISVSRGELKSGQVNLDAVIDGRFARVIP